MSKSLDMHFGLRLGCIILIWFALGGTILNSSDQVSFLSALLLYLIPMAFDYYSQEPVEDRNKKRKSLGVWSAVLLASICLGFTFAGFNMEAFLLLTPVKIITWILSVFYVIMALADWVAYSSPEEQKHRENIRELVRENKSHEPMEERVEYYRESNARN